MKNSEKIQRFGVLFRIQHFILFSCVLLLMVSGLPLKFPDSQIAQFAVRLQGGMDGRALIHHGAGLTLIGLGIFHFTYYLIFDRNVRFLKLFTTPMMVRPKDIADFLHHLGYLVGIKKSLPKMGRYTWFEKLDYYGLIWGFALMAGTGLAMLYMDVVVEFMPMVILQVLWAAHSEEAMLATLFLLIIHMYHVNFNPDKFPFTLTWLTGRISKKEMKKYHPLEMEELAEDNENPAGK